MRVNLQAEESWPVRVERPRELIHVRRNITSYIGVPIDEPRTTKRRILLVHHQLEIRAVLLNVVCIVDAVQPCTEVDDSNFAIAGLVEHDLGNLVVRF